MTLESALDSADAEKLAAQDAKNAAEYSVDDAVEQIGFGRFQVFIIFMAGLAWIAASMEVMVISIAGPVLECDWNITNFEVANLTTIVMAGFGFGSFFAGIASDKIGRRKTLLVAALWTTAFGIITSSVANMNWMYVFRFLVGLGAGGSIQTITYAAEFLPTKSRGKGIIILRCFWAAGGCIEVLLAMAILPYFDWRWWIGGTAVPSLIFAFCCIWLPETPRFDLISGREEDALRTLEIAARWNGVEMPSGKLVANQTNVERGSIADVWRPGYRLLTALLGPIWFICMFNYFGGILITTEIISQDTTCNPWPDWNFDQNVTTAAVMEVEHVLF